MPRPQDKAKVPKDLRVRECMVLMVSGRWVTGKTDEELSRKWETSVATVRRDAGEASRRINDGMLLDDDLHGLLVANLQACISDLEFIRTVVAEESPMTAVRAIEAKVNAVKALAGLRGIMGKNMSGDDSNAEIVRALRQKLQEMDQ